MTIEEIQKRIGEEYGDGILNQFNERIDLSNPPSFQQALEIIDEVLSPNPVYPSSGRTNSKSGDGKFSF